MNVLLFCTGKTNEKFIQEGIEFYLNRIRKKLRFDVKYIPDIKNAGKMDVETIRNAEAKILLEMLNVQDHVVLLDDKGSQMTSMEFSVYLNKKFSMSFKRLIFVLGGAYGFGEELYERANETLSLSRMTFPHHLVRVIFLEQLYRGLSILHNEPYHNE